MKVRPLTEPLSCWESMLHWIAHAEVQLDKILLRASTPEPNIQLVEKVRLALKQELRVTKHTRHVTLAGVR